MKTFKKISKNNCFLISIIYLLFAFNYLCKGVDMHPKKIGHRGACGYEPENTLRSFKKALDLNVDMVELDVHNCKSGELVVIHDEKIDRTTNGKGFVKDLTLDELKKYDAGLGEIIPTLEEVLDLIDRKVKVAVELKGKHTAAPVALLIEKYVKEKGWLYDDFLVISFMHDEVFEFKKLCLNVSVGLSFAKIPKDKKALEEEMNDIDYLVTSFKRINLKFIEQMDKKGVKVIAYTVNKTRDIKRMTDFGVYGIVSDYPDLI